MNTIYQNLKKLFEKHDCRNHYTNYEEVSLENFPHFKLEIDTERLIKCGVLIILFKENNEFYILLTIRNFYLKSYPGEICYPGGKFDKELDKNIQDTAFRETYEEIGLVEDKLDLVCQLCNFLSPEGHLITPFVCLLKDTKKLDMYENNLDLVKSLKPNPKEVASIFWVPFSYFLNNDKIDEHFFIFPTKINLEGSLSEMENFVKNKFLFSAKSVNRVFINFTDQMFSNKILPNTPFLYGINASILLFIILTIENKSKFNFRLNEHFTIRVDTIEIYIKFVRFISYLVYKNTLAKSKEKIKIKSKI